MRIDIITLFPEMFEGPFARSIVGRARERGLVRIGFVNPRDFAKDRRRTVDDRPYGGGKGMLLMAEPLYQAIRSVRRRNTKVIYLSPQGRKFVQATARDLTEEQHLVLLCGHYEGIDERIVKYVDMEISMGDFVLTGGEIPAMAVTDAIVRLLPGVLPEGASDAESFSRYVLEYPQYTRPRIWKGRRVPSVLVTGDHARIEEWRRSSAQQATMQKRPTEHQRGSAAPIAVGKRPTEHQRGSAAPIAVGKRPTEHQRGSAAPIAVGKRPNLLNQSLDH